MLLHKTQQTSASTEFEDKKLWGSVHKLKEGMQKFVEEKNPSEYKKAFAESLRHT